LGDTIYGDKLKSLRDIWRDRFPIKLFKEATPQDLQWKYTKLMKNRYYNDLRRNVKIIGTWDDHDYGLNDGCKTYKHKKESQGLFLDFIGESPNSPRRKQEGVYTSHLFGTGNNKVNFILLDVRYHKDPWNKGKEILGEAQWSKCIVAHYFLHFLKEYFGY